jgi:hypothetical protein
MKFVFGVVREMVNNISMDTMAEGRSGSKLSAI